MSERLATRVKRPLKLSSWLTMISVAPAAAMICEQEIEKRLLTVAVERGCRLVGDDKLRRANQRARSGHTLLLANAEICSGGALMERALDAQTFEEPRRGGLGASLRLRRACAALPKN